MTNTKLDFKLDTGQKLAYAWPPVASFIGFCYAFYCYYCVSRININSKEKLKSANMSQANDDDAQKLKSPDAQPNGIIEQVENENPLNNHNPARIVDSDAEIFRIYSLIRDGAIRFFIGRI